jgi:hypothetical protein
LPFLIFHFDTCHMELPETPSDVEIEKLRRKVGEHPTDLQFRFDFAVVLYRRQKYSEAIHELQKAQQLPAARWRAMDLLARCYDAKGMTDFAAQVRARLSKETGDDNSDGSAPVPAPKRPITPIDSFHAERRPDEDEHTA